MKDDLEHIGLDHGLCEWLETLRRNGETISR